MRRLTYTNPAGTSIVLGVPATSTEDYIITSLEGLGAAEGDTQVQKAPSQDGVTYLDYLLSVRDVVVECKIRSQDLATIQAAKRTLVSALNGKLGPGTLEYYNGTSTYTISALPIKSPLFPNKLKVEPFQSFMVTFACHDPYWLGASALCRLGGSTALLTFPMTFPVEMSTGPNAQTQTINNVGDVPLGAVITLMGPAVNPRITNGTTGEYIRFEHAFSADDEVVITTTMGAKSVVANFGDGNGMQYLDLVSTFFQLAVGNNVLTVTDDNAATTVSATVQYAPKYLGV